MALPSFTVVGNLFEILGDVSGSELVESPPTTLRLTFTPNISSVSTPVTYDGNLYKIGIVYGGIEDDGTIVHSSIVNGVNVTDGDPIQLLAQDAGLNVTGLMWKVSLEAPIADKTGWTRLMSWWIDAYADGATVDLSQVAPSVEAPANLNLVTYDLDTVTVVGEALITAPSELAAREAISAVSDFDFRLDDTRTPTDASVTLDKLTPALKSAVENMSGSAFTTTDRYVLNTESTDDETTKETYFGVPHYDNTEDPVSGVTVFSSDTYNMVRVGGGSLYGRAANQVEFYTAADQVTDFGTRAGYINAAGRWSFLLNAEFGSNSTNNDTFIRLNTAAGNNRSITFASAGSGRWIIVTDDTTESGSDAGSDLIIRSRTDAGAAKTDVVTFSRADGSATFGGPVITAASTASTSGLRLPNGTAPSDPTNGDLWTTTAGVWARVNGQSERLASTTDTDDDERIENGEATLKRRDANTSVNTNSGNLRLTYFQARKTETITAIRTFSANTAQVGATLCRVGVYEEDPDNGDLTLVASIANDTSLWASTSTTYPVNLSASFVKTRGTRYAVGSLVVGASTYPTLPGPYQILPAGELGQSPRQCGVLGGQSDLPASISAGSISDSNLQHYTVLVP